MSTLISLPDVTGDGKPDIALSNEYDFGPEELNIDSASLLQG